MLRTELLLGALLVRGVARQLGADCLRLPPSSLRGRRPNPPHSRATAPPAAPPAGEVPLLQVSYPDGVAKVTTTIASTGFFHTKASGERSWSVCPCGVCSRQLGRGRGRGMGQGGNVVALGAALGME